MVKIRRQKTRPNTLVSAASARGERWRTSSIGTRLIGTLKIHRVQLERFSLARHRLPSYKLQYNTAMKLRCQVQPCFSFIASSVITE